MIPIRTLIEIYRIAKQFFEYPSVTVLLAVIGITTIVTYRKQIAGFAVRSGKFLNYIAINKKFQGKGLGKKLFTKIQPNIRRLQVHPKNHLAINMYRRYGFEVKKQVSTILGKRLLMER